MGADKIQKIQQRLAKKGATDVTAKKGAVKKGLTKKRVGVTDLPPVFAPNLDTNCAIKAAAQIGGKTDAAVTMSKEGKTFGVPHTPPKAKYSYYKAHPDKAKAIAKRYRDAHPDRVKTWSKTYQARKAAAKKAS